MTRADQLPELTSQFAGRTVSSSARNRMAGVVVSVKCDSVMAQVELACGDYRIVSLMSREAADALGLEPGKPATAIVKDTDLIIDA